MTPEHTAEFRGALRQAADDLLAYFERRVSIRDDAADLLGETMLQAWRRAGDLPPTAERRRMWLFTIAANVLGNHRRSARRRTALAGRVRQQLATSNEPDHAEADAVRDAVLRLGSAQRDLVLLVHWDGFSIVEAAEILGLNPSTARGRYAAARDALRTALSPTAAST
ncbi:RNA polymerase, sigma-24 subunit, ECF subfamily [Kribbella flavida DSM 17836]|uniref:RNA polymerase, sigma-24 subunit, ECF subfamily n=1 Tax=Kribbella flavida (strain DSM 17836 / JCM 10339 / NBRC 14399) TaxID=479435 RepID=D2PZP0_KRIFD|nr:sigma-70 family RNA polymerase sigma factor [Kribbella flavida]ADB35606.1 RNA polymerase, sigma-24 subunit, ECF subfamily [Kribbella flavida DSM 17836]